MSICNSNSGHSPADLLDTGDPAEHLRQLGGSTLRYEVPINKVNATINLIRKAGQFLNPNITVVGVVPPASPIK